MLRRAFLQVVLGTALALPSLCGEQLKLEEPEFKELTEQQRMILDGFRAEIHGSERPDVQHTPLWFTVA